jgi:hypothetical protein
MKIEGKNKMTGTTKPGRSKKGMQTAKSVPGMKMPKKGMKMSKKSSY